MWSSIRTLERACDPTKLREFDFCMNASWGTEILVDVGRFLQTKCECEDVSKPSILSSAFLNAYEFPEFSRGLGKTIQSITLLWTLLSKYPV
jgi:hypothetical protein